MTTSTDNTVAEKPVDEVPVTVMLPLNEIFIDDGFNSRGEILPMDVIDLARDVERNGLLQPVIVTQLNDPAKPEYKYKLIAGFRRTKAHIVLKRTHIPALIKKNISNTQAIILNLSENMHRQTLNMLQEAKAIKHLIDIGISRQTVAKHVGMSPGWVQLRTILLALPTIIQDEVAAGFIGQDNLRKLYTLYKNGGEDAALAGMRKVKDAKLQNKKRAVDLQQTDPTIKRHRKKSEINSYLLHLLEFLPPGFWSECLAWCAGNITNDEFTVRIQAFADTEGVEYKDIDNDLEKYSGERDEDAGANLI